MEGSWRDLVHVSWRCVCTAQVGFMRFISYGTFFRYTVDAFVYLQYADRDDGCGMISSEQWAALAKGGRSAQLAAGRQACAEILTSQASCCRFLYVCPVCLLMLLLL